jgi:hypothetical protein
MKRKYQTLPPSTQLLLGATLLLVTLLLSATVLLYRVTLVNQRLELLPQARYGNYNGNGNGNGNEGDVGEATARFVGEEVQRVVAEVHSKLREVTGLRKSLEELLRVVQRLPHYCS